jgi:hypothetical protein
MMEEGARKRLRRGNTARRMKIKTRKSRGKRNNWRRKAEKRKQIMEKKKES